MGILQCQKCFITAEADNKEAAIAKIDHAANSKKCDGKDENCNWYTKGIPVVILNPVIDPKRPIQGVATQKVIVAQTAKSTPRQTRK